MYMLFLKVSFYCSWVSASSTVGKDVVKIVYNNRKDFLAIVWTSFVERDRCNSDSSLKIKCRSCLRCMVSAKTTNGTKEADLIFQEFLALRGFVLPQVLEKESFFCLIFVVQKKKQKQNLSMQRIIIVWKSPFRTQEREAFWNAQDWCTSCNLLITVSWKGLLPSY